MSRSTLAKALRTRAVGDRAGMGPGTEGVLVAAESARGGRLDHECFQLCSRVRRTSQSYRRHMVMADW
ncbi:hypothetical protein GS498_18900 [Rhodococcus hoagii]|nr:hypothetical protein [Prescottella equi]